MKILAIGDIFGKIGRKIIKCYLGRIKQEYQIDLVIANVENATHGKGISFKHYQELKNFGIDIMTSGNHIFHLEETQKEIDKFSDLIRPLNSNPFHPGKGTILKEWGKGFILVDERDLWPPEGKFVTANMLARTDYLKDNPEIIKKLLEAHVNETLWINQKLSKTNDTKIDEKNIQELTVAFNEGLKKITGKTYPEGQIRDALSRIEFTYDPLSASLNKIAEDASDLGYINLESSRGIDLASIYDLGPLNEVLKSKGLGTVQ